MYFTNVYLCNWVANHLAFFWKQEEKEFTLKDCSPDLPLAETRSKSLPSCWFGNHEWQPKTADVGWRRGGVKSKRRKQRPETTATWTACYLRLLWIMEEKNPAWYHIIARDLLSLTNCESCEPRLQDIQSRDRKLQDSTAIWRLWKLCGLTGA